jgi:asparagine synthase (glutamine-hydrolysing)
MILMGGIAGIAESGMRNEVNRMLDKMAHRGHASRKVIEFDNATLGAVYTEVQKEQMDSLEKDKIASDFVADGHYAYAKILNDGIFLERDQLGVSPLYYGHNENQALCFTSEIKALIDFTNDIHELPPGHRYISNKTESYYKLEKKQPLDLDPDNIARELYKRLEISVSGFVVGNDPMGVWLSGGLDSSTMASFARPLVRKLHTFSAGFPESPDLVHARIMAEHIESDHHEIIVNLDDLLSALPEVIYHLESFDALLVRSSIANFLVSQDAARHVAAVLSGEGGDELFAGYTYLKSLDLDELANELIDITGRLHNTALQRVDRSASAHGTVAHVGFLDPKVVEYALQIPTKYKIFKNVEEWILRKAMNEKLPKEILNRKKAKFWHGSGIETCLHEYAEAQIDNEEFERFRKLPNGFILNTKEEFMYYRIFRKYFKDLKNLSWMGRTKGAPKQ